MNKKFSIPSKVSFSEEIMNVNNPNFHPVKLRIMTSGQNWNFSDIKKEGFESAKDTIAYSPILANVVERNDGELDANGHDVDYDMHIDYNGNMQVKEIYIERPVGVFINNSTTIVEEDDKVYFESYGYIWKCYSDIYEILKRDEDKDVSVEIEVIDGQFNDYGYYEINEFTVLGCTILGNGNEPAIDKSNIQFNFSKEDNKEYFDNLEELKTILNKQFAKEVEDSMNDNKDQVKDEEFAKDEEVCPTCGKNPCECNNDDEVEENAKKKRRCETDEEDDNEVCPVCGENPCICDDDKDDDEEDMKKKKKCEKEDNSKEEKDPKIYSQKEMDEVLVELNILREFKAEYDKQIELAKLENDVQEIVDKFSFAEDSIKELKEKAMNKEITLDQFELSLFRMSYSKKDFSKKEEKQDKPASLKIADINKDNKENKAVDDLFKKYGL